MDSTVPENVDIVTMELLVTLWMDTVLKINAIMDIAEWHAINVSAHLGCFIARIFI